MVWIHAKPLLCKGDAYKDEKCSLITVGLIINVQQMKKMCVFWKPSWTCCAEMNPDFSLRSHLWNRLRDKLCQHESDILMDHERGSSPFGLRGKRLQLHPTSYEPPCWKDKSSASSPHSLFPLISCWRSVAVCFSVAEQQHILFFWHLLGN